MSAKAAETFSDGAYATHADDYDTEDYGCYNEYDDGGPSKSFMGSHSRDGRRSVQSFATWLDAESIADNEARRASIARETKQAQYRVFREQLRERLKLRAERKKEVVKQVLENIYGWLLAVCAVR